MGNTSTNELADPGPTLGEMVRAWRVNGAGLSLRALARETGISAGQLSRIETGETQRPSIKTVLVLAQALNFHSSVLLALAGHLDERSARLEFSQLVEEARDDLAREYGDGGDYADELLERARSVGGTDAIRDLAMEIATLPVSSVDAPPELAAQPPGQAPDRAMLRDLIEVWHSMTPERRWRLFQTAKDFSAASDNEAGDSREQSDERG